MTATIAESPLRRAGRLVNALSVDIEDHGQAEANTHRLLDLLAETRAKATIFTPGRVAERHPLVVRRVVAEGHELASHGFGHQRGDQLTPEAFRADVRRAKAVLEATAGVVVAGYRAPGFSLGERTPWAWRILAEEGHRYDSSVHPLGLYGAPEAPRFPYAPDGCRGLVEIPVAVARIAGRHQPCGGGGWFRLLPYALSRHLLAGINRAEGRPCVFYLHPWEIDPAQTPPAGLGWGARLGHTFNRTRPAPRLRRLLADFTWDRIDRVFLQA